MWEGLNRKSESSGGRGGGGGSGGGGSGGGDEYGDRESDRSRDYDGDGGDKPVDYDEMEMAPPTSFGGKGGKGGR